LFPGVGWENKQKKTGTKVPESVKDYHHKRVLEKDELTPWPAEGKAGQHWKGASHRQNKEDGRGFLGGGCAVAVKERT